MKRKNRSAFGSLIRLVFTDLVLTGIALLVFAYFHHVKPSQLEPVGTTSSRYEAGAAETLKNTPAAFHTPEPSPSPSPSPKAAETDATLSEPLNTEPAAVTPVPALTPAATVLPTPSPTPDPVGYFGSRHKEQFTDGEIIREDNRYVSSNLSVTLTTHRENGVVYHVADFYIRDISSFKTVFANDKYGKGYSEWLLSADKRTNSVLTINGDFYGLRNYGVIIRNGTLYRTMKNAICDYLVLFWDGTMKIYGPGPVDTDSLMAAGAYQSWYFGPMLLDENGGTMTEFNSDLTRRNPRSAIGYFEPGHYCFVMVEGRRMFPAA